MGFVFRRYNLRTSFWKWKDINFVLTVKRVCVLRFEERKLAFGDFIHARFFAGDPSFFRMESHIFLRSDKSVTWRFFYEKAMIWSYD